MSEGKRWYYYLHRNGDVIGKNPITVDSDPHYFDSDFVVKYWLITDRKSLVEMLIELKETNARPDRIATIEKVNKIGVVDYHAVRMVDVLSGDDTKPQGGVKK